MKSYYLDSSAVRLLGILLLVFSGFNSYSQCTDYATFGVNQGTLTIDADPSSYETIAITGQDYFTVPVSCGNIYSFDFCANGGGTTDILPVITVLDGALNVLETGPFNGACAEVTYISGFTGTITVYITDDLDGCTGAPAWTGTMAFNEESSGSIDASFTLTPACGGATATITGNPGGSFAFNPAPGDGAQVNSTTGTISNGTVGTTYSIEYTICGISSTESATVITDDCWAMNGNAQTINVSGEECIQLTAPVNLQLGCAWSSSQIDFASDFNLSLDYYFGNNINGADGNTFTFQPSASTACGTAGGQLGAGGLVNALSIEFDTYDNDNPAHVYDMVCDHIAIEVDGDHQNAAPAAGPVCAKTNMGNIDDGGTYEVEINWNAATMTLEVYFDGVLRLTYMDDIVNNVFGGQSLVYWGATSATGGLNNQQYFCPSSVVILPVSLTSFTSKCSDQEEVFTWITSSEENADYFTLEYTYDGFIYYPETVVQAVGNSTTMQTYQARVSTPDDNTRYYRLKMTDFNGSYENSDIIASQQCRNTSEMVQSILQDATQLTINVNEPCYAMLVNMIGQQVSNTISINEKGALPLYGLATGMYHLILAGANGTNELHQVMVH